MGNSNSNDYKLDRDITSTLRCPDFESISYRNGSVYEGSTKKIRGSIIRDGFGMLCLPDGSVFYGEWLSDNLHGCGGILTESSNYIGEFSNGEKSGMGFQIDPYGIRAGLFTENKRFGTGILIDEHGFIFREIVNKDMTSELSQLIAQTDQKSPNSSLHISTVHAMHLWTPRHIRLFVAALGSPSLVAAVSSLPIECLCANSLLNGKIFQSCMDKPFFIPDIFLSNSGQNNTLNKQKNFPKHLPFFTSNFNHLKTSNSTSTATKTQSIFSKLITHSMPLSQNPSATSKSLNDPHQHCSRFSFHPHLLSASKSPSMSPSSRAPVPIGHLLTFQHSLRVAIMVRRLLSSESELVKCSEALIKSQTKILAEKRQLQSSTINSCNALSSSHSSSRLIPPHRGKQRLKQISIRKPNQTIRKRSKCQKKRNSVTPSILFDARLFSVTALESYPRGGEVLDSDFIRCTKVVGRGGYGTVFKGVMIDPSAAKKNMEGVANVGANNNYGGAGINAQVSGTGQMSLIQTIFSIQPGNSSTLVKRNNRNSSTVNFEISDTPSNTSSNLNAKKKVDVLLSSNINANPSCDHSLHTESFHEMALTGSANSSELFSNLSKCRNSESPPVSPPGLNLLSIDSHLLAHKSISDLFKASIPSETFCRATSNDNMHRRMSRESNTLVDSSLRRVDGQSVPSRSLVTNTSSLLQLPPLAVDLSSAVAAASANAATSPSRLSVSSSPAPSPLPRASPSSDHSVLNRARNWLRSAPLGDLTLQTLLNDDTSRMELQLRRRQLEALFKGQGGDGSSGDGETDSEGDGVGYSNSMPFSTDRDNVLLRQTVNTNAMSPPLSYENGVCDETFNTFNFVLTQMDASNNKCEGNLHATATALVTPCELLDEIDGCHELDNSVSIPLLQNINADSLMQQPSKCFPNDFPHSPQYRLHVDCVSLSSSEDDKSSERSSFCSSHADAHMQCGDILLVPHNCSKRRAHKVRSEGIICSRRSLNKNDLIKASPSPIASSFDEIPSAMSSPTPHPPLRRASTFYLQTFNDGTSPLCAPTHSPVSKFSSQQCASSSAIIVPTEPSPAPATAPGVDDISRPQLRRSISLQPSHPPTQGQMASNTSSRDHAHLSHLHATETSSSIQTTNVSPFVYHQHYHHSHHDASDRSSNSRLQLRNAKTEITRLQLTLAAALNTPSAIPATNSSYISFAPNQAIPGVYSTRISSQQAVSPASPVKSKSSHSPHSPYHVSDGFLDRLNDRELSHNALPLVQRASLSPAAIPLSLNSCLQDLKDKQLDSFSLLNSQLEADFLIPDCNSTGHSTNVGNGLEMAAYLVGTNPSSTITSPVRHRHVSSAKMGMMLLQDFISEEGSMISQRIEELEEDASSSITSSLSIPEGVPNHAQEDNVENSTTDARTIAEIAGPIPLGNDGLPDLTALRTVAVKVYTGLSSASALRDVLRELSLARGVRHPNLISVYGISLHDIGGEMKKNNNFSKKKKKQNQTLRIFTENKGKLNDIIMNKPMDGTYLSSGANNNSEAIITNTFENGDIISMLKLEQIKSEINSLHSSNGNNTNIIDMSCINQDGILNRTSISNSHSVPVQYYPNFNSRPLITQSGDDNLDDNSAPPQSILLKNKSLKQFHFVNETEKKSRNASSKININGNDKSSIFSSQFSDSVVSDSPTTSLNMSSLIGSSDNESESSISSSFPSLAFISRSPSIKFDDSINTTNEMHASARAQIRKHTVAESTAERLVAMFTQKEDSLISHIKALNTAQQPMSLNTSAMMTGRRKRSDSIGGLSQSNNILSAMPRLLPGSHSVILDPDAAATSFNSASYHPILNISSCSTPLSTPCLPSPRPPSIHVHHSKKKKVQMPLLSNDLREFNQRRPSLPPVALPLNVVPLSETSPVLASSSHNMSSSAGVPNQLNTSVSFNNSHNPFGVSMPYIGPASPHAIIRGNLSFSSVSAAANLDSLRSPVPTPTVVTPRRRIDQPMEEAQTESDSESNHEGLNNSEFAATDQLLSLRTPLLSPMGLSFSPSVTPPSMIPLNQAFTNHALNDESKSIKSERNFLNSLSSFPFRTPQTSHHATCLHSSSDSSESPPTTSASPQSIQVLPASPSRGGESTLLVCSKPPSGLTSNSLHAPSFSPVLFPSSHTNSSSSKLMSTTLRRFVQSASALNVFSSSKFHHTANSVDHALGIGSTQSFNRASKSTRGQISQLKAAHRRATSFAGHSACAPLLFTSHAHASHKRVQSDYDFPHKTLLDHDVNVHPPENEIVIEPSSVSIIVHDETQDMQHEATIQAFHLSSISQSTTNLERSSKCSNLRHRDTHRHHRQVKENKKHAEQHQSEEIDENSFLSEILPSNLFVDLPIIRLKPDDREPGLPILLGDKYDPPELVAKSKLNSRYNVDFDEEIEQCDHNACSTCGENLLENHDSLSIDDKCDEYKSDSDFPSNSSFKSDTYSTNSDSNDSSLRDGECDFRAALVMELMPRARSLSSFITEGSLSITDAIYALREVARGLAFLHSRGIVHLDVKSPNVVLSPPSKTHGNVIDSIENATNSQHPSSLSSHANELEKELRIRKWSVKLCDLGLAQRVFSEDDLNSIKSHGLEDFLERGMLRRSLLPGASCWENDTTNSDDSSSNKSDSTEAFENTAKPSITLKILPQASPSCLLRKTLKESLNLDESLNLTTSGVLRPQLSTDDPFGIFSPVNGRKGKVSKIAISSECFPNLDFLVDGIRNIDFSSAPGMTANVACGSQAAVVGIVGSHGWIAPEILRGESAILAADVYSFGVLIWECITGCIPFSELGFNQLAVEVGYGIRQLRSMEDMLAFLSSNTGRRKLRQKHQALMNVVWKARQQHEGEQNNIKSNKNNKKLNSREDKNNNKSKDSSTIPFSLPSYSVLKQKIIPQGLSDLQRACCEFDPRYRPSMHQVAIILDKLLEKSLECEVQLEDFVFG